FANELYCRIAVVQIEVPALRERRQDIAGLVDHFVTQFRVSFNTVVRGASPAAVELLANYPWPGNVRELQTCIGRAAALAQRELIQLDDLPDNVRADRVQEILPCSDEPDALISLGELERRYILRVLQILSGNKTLAAQTLGLDRKTLYRKLQQYEH